MGGTEFELANKKREMKRSVHAVSTRSTTLLPTEKNYTQRRCLKTVLTTWEPKYVDACIKQMCIEPNRLAKCKTYLSMKVLRCQRVRSRTKESILSPSYFVTANQNPTAAWIPPDHRIVNTHTHTHSNHVA